MLLEHIKKSTFFQGINPAALTEIAAHCYRRKIKKGTTLFSMGDQASAFFIIMQGWVKLHRISREGEETIVHIFGPGESFAEAAVFNDRCLYPVDAQALEDTEIIVVPRAVIIQKIESNSNFALHMLGAIASRQHYLVQQLEQVTSRSAPQRIGAFLLRFCRQQQGHGGALVVDLPYDKSVIASRLNIKPETFSRALAKLKPHGVFSQNRQIIIAAPHKLADFCDISLMQQQR